MTRPIEEKPPASGGPAPNTDPDGGLVAALQRGEPEAAERLVAAYGNRAYRLAIGIAGNLQDAEEAVQDGLRNVVREIAPFPAGSAFGAWVYGRVATAAYQKLRSRAGPRTDIALDDVLPVFHEAGPHAVPITDWTAQVDDVAGWAKLSVALTAAIQELPVQYRGALILRDVEGLSNEEVSQALGIPTATVKARVHRARLFLRARLSAAQRQ